MNARTLLKCARAAFAAVALAFVPGAPAQVPAAADPATRPLREAPRVPVARIRFEGNTVLPEADLVGVAASYEGRTLQAEDLEALRVEVTRRYVAAGYLNSGAVIPDQTVVDGVLVVRIVEGGLAAVEVSGEHVFQPGYLEDRLRVAAGSPLNVNRLQEAMQVMLQEGAIERINAELAPGDVPGEAILRTRVREAPRLRVEFAVANNRPPNLGETAGEVRLSARNSWGLNETLAANYSLSEGNDEWGVSASVPVTANDTAVYARAGRTLGTVVEAPFDRIDLMSVYETAELGVSHPWIRALDRSLVTTLSLSRTRTTTYLMGEPFPINPGSDDGRMRVTALRPAAEWVQRDADRVLAGRFAVGLGLSAFGSTTHDDPRLPDSRFVTGLGQVQWIARVDDGKGQVVMRTDFQLASSRLPSSEQFPMGGVASVRGYRENTLIRDRGITGSIEYRRLVGRVPVPGLSSDPLDGAVQVAAFVDAGVGKDVGGTSDSLASLGFGVRWAAGGGLDAFVYKGFPQRNEPGGSNALQDNGIHFRIGYQRRF
jgi:hemolysin activation/secretion protein